MLGREVARYVVRRQLTSYLHPNTASGPSDRTKENFEHNGSTIKYPKSPSVERNGTPAIFRQQFKQKDAAESDRKIRLKHKNVKKC